MKKYISVVVSVILICFSVSAPAFAETRRGFWMDDPLSNYQINGGYLYGEWDSINDTTAHKGVDSYGASEGQPVYLVADGYIQQTGYDQYGWGNYIVMRHTDPDGKTIYTRYAHLSSIDISGTNKFYRGTTIGKVGNTGQSSGAHLHFTVEFNYSMSNGTGVWNPEYFLSRSKTTSYGAFQGYVKNSSGSFIRSTASTGLRISGFTKNDPNFGARYSYGTMNSGQPFYDEADFNVNYMTGKITPNTYWVEYKHPSYTTQINSVGISANGLTVKNVTMY